MSKDREQELVRAHGAVARVAGEMALALARHRLRRSAPAEWAAALRAAAEKLEQLQ